MKKNQSIGYELVFMVVLTAFLIGCTVISTGAYMIYTATVDGMETELAAAVKTLEKLYHKGYEGDLSYSGGECSVGGETFSAEDFSELIDCISCGESVDFTMFWEDTRIFTTVTSMDGRNAAGTKAAENVVEKVLDEGCDYLYQKVLVNDEYYMGYYLPIKDSDGMAVGMFFAGKPLKNAEHNMWKAVERFSLLSLLIIILALLACMAYARRIAVGLMDISIYIRCIAQGDFDVVLSKKTLKQRNEIGEIGANVKILRNNFRDMVECDPLTKLLNRRSSSVRMEQLAEEGIFYSVVMGDIDFFKRINDTYGHVAGDCVLKDVSAALKHCAREHEGFAVRWGGEEFLLIFPEMKMDRVYEIVRDLLEELRAMECRYEDKTIHLTMTFGISCSRVSDDSIDDAIRRADTLLYEGKQSGRDTIVRESSAE